MTTKFIKKKHEYREAFGWNEVSFIVYYISDTQIQKSSIRPGFHQIVAEKDLD